MISNVSLSYPNRLEECTITSNGTFVTTLPLSNLHNKVLKRVARTVGTADLVIDLYLSSEEREIGCIAIAGHNFSTNAKVQFQGWSSAGSAHGATGLRFDSGNEYRAYPIIYPNDSGIIPFESKNWFLGTVEESQRKSYTALATYFAPDNQMCRYLRITIRDPVNSDGYLQMGRIFLGRTIEPKQNPEYGDISQGYVDLTETKLSANNSKYHFIKPKMRTVSCTLKHLDKQEAFLGFYDAQREVGLSGELLYAFSKPEYIGNLNMTTDKSFYARTFLCNFSALSPIEMPYVNGYSTVLQLEEIV